jgi:hypothetical protein
MPFSQEHDKDKAPIENKKGRESILTPALSVREFSSPSKATYASIDVTAQTIF